MTRTSQMPFVKRLIPIAFILSGAAMAADFPAAKSFEQKSMTKGFEQNEVMLITRAKGPGAEKIADDLLQALKGKPQIANVGGEFKKDVSKKRVAFIGNGWTLHVYADGTKIRYRNFQAEEKMKEGKPVSERPAQDRLESLGRDFIKNHLSQYVRLGEQEELVPYFTEFAIAGGGSTEEGAAPEQERVHGATVVFTRSIRGVPVVGPGSKVAVMFANDGMPVGFDVDWPIYKAAEKKQRVLPLDKIKERAKTLIPLGIGQTDVIVEKLVCGLYDSGASKHDPNTVVQSACMFKTSSRVSVATKGTAPGHLLKAYINFVPAGVSVEPDPAWADAMKVRGERPAPPMTPPGPAPQTSR